MEHPVITMSGDKTLWNQQIVSCRCCSFVVVVTILMGASTSCRVHSTFQVITLNESKKRKMKPNGRVRVSDRNKLQVGASARLPTLCSPLFRTFDALNQLRGGQSIWRKN